MPAWSLLEVPIEPKSASDAELLNSVLSDLIANESELSFTRDEESGLCVLGGMSEDQLDITITRLRHSNCVEFAKGVPMVAYRELIGRAVRIDYVHKRIFGPRGEFAKVVIDFAPAKAGTGFAFENRAGNAVPSEFVHGVEKGLENARQNGVCAGFPLTDFTAALVDGDYHDVDSSPREFEIAARGAVRKLKEKGDVQIAEPVMTIEVTTPTDFIDRIIRDLNSRRGVVEDQMASGGTATLKAAVPLASMFGYVNMLSSISQGRATHTMRFRAYRTIPRPDSDPPFQPNTGMRTWG